ncbi:MAG: peptidoglycan DD-metalloendopeptidase family protein [Cyclobacteriaceae bacterium]|nr:peptidoglycan DD-metalloendopeptidase family protein [Cyclobacteriaceae bacterium SS2]
MKKIASLIFLCILFFRLYAQETVIFEGEKGGFEGKSYLVVKSLKLIPGFEVSATQDGEWFARAIDQEPSNKPPSLDKNFVRTEVAREEITDENEFSGADYTRKITSFDYSDGLGRPSQSVIAKSSYGQHDIVQPNKYNSLTGLNDTTYLPYTTYGIESVKTGEFRDNAYAPNIVNEDQGEQNIFYSISGPYGVSHDDSPYSYTDYEQSPLLRAASARGVGSEWKTAGKDNGYEYSIYVEPSEVDEKIIRWEIDDNSTTSEKEDDKPIQSSFDGFYGDGELTITQRTNEDGYISQTINDNRGVRIANRSKKDASDWVTTYYIYDFFGRVRFIIPPALVESIVSTDPITNPSVAQTDGLMFQYIYDARGRLIKEKAPDSGWKYYCYDKWDRLAASQDAAQRSGNKWTFYKYDQYNRVIMTGIVLDPDDQDDLQSAIMTGTTLRHEDSNTPSNIGYTTNLTWPTSYDELYTITYYDDYAFISSAWDPNHANYSFNADGLNISQNTLGVKGLVTGSKVNVLGTSDWLNTVVYYDKYYRQIQLVAENHLDGIDRISTEYNFAGDLLKTKLNHSADLKPGVVYLQEYDYDDRGRVLNAWNQINYNGATGDKILMAGYEYNELGEVIEKNLHSTDNGSTYLQSLDYRYNIRGWLETINTPELSNDPTEDNDDLFGAKYHYNDPPTITGTSGISRYDGTLAALEWKNSNNGITSFDQSIFGYEYDNLNQLKDANYATGSGTSFTTSDGYFDETISYEDLNGNIGTIIRKSDNSQIDDLDFRYFANSNKVEGIHETASASEGYKYKNYNDPQLQEYEYDAGTGNLLTDANKDISNEDIAYNHLNLVTRIPFNDGSEINYTYDAVGNRLSKTLLDANDQVLLKIDYVGLIEYKDDEIYQIFTDEGRAYFQNDDFHYEYMITDHQGNNRVSFGILPERNVYSTTLEESPDQHFSVPSNVRQPINNHTPTGVYSAHLNKAVGRTVGPAKVIEVTAGDNVSLEAWGQFESNGSSALNTAHNIAGILTSALGITSGGSPTEHSTLTNLINSPAGGLFVFNGGSGSSVPQAYLQWIYLDESYNFINGGFDGLQSGISVYQQLQIDISSETLDEDGYLYVYVANETDYDMDVFFDDIQITHESSPTSYKVTLVNDYYPFGMLMATSWSKDGYLSPGLAYQSYYSVYDDLFGTYDFFLRNYDPTIGRWLQTDPYSQFASPYVGMGNGPHVGVDPDGGAVEGLVFESLLLELGIVASAGALYGGLTGHFNENRGVSALIGAGIFLGGYGLGRIIPYIEMPNLNFPHLPNPFQKTAQMIANDPKLLQLAKVRGPEPPKDLGEISTPEFRRSLDLDRRRNRGNIILPFDGATVTSGFGPRDGRIHSGVDLGARNPENNLGTPVRAVKDIRIVRLVTQLDGNAGGIRVRGVDENGIQYNFFHLQPGSNAHLTSGQIVRQGQILGRIGGSGFRNPNAFAPHLHYEIWSPENQPISPYTMHPDLIYLPNR